MDKKDYYETLGVKKDATPDDIKKAYRKLAIQYHPDKNPNDKDAEEMFKEIAEAYDVLNTPNKRQEYDQYGHNGKKGQGFGTYDFTDIYNNFFGRQENRQTVNKGGSIRINFPLTLEEIYTGINKKIKFKKMDVCPDCGGVGHDNSGKIDICPHCNGNGVSVEVRQNGNMMFQQIVTCPHCKGEGQIVINPCKTCHGMGVVEKEAEIDIDIPKGVEHGMQLTVEGKGSAPIRNNGVYGDLILVITQKPHTWLNRDKNTIITLKQINVLDALLGGSINVNCIDGSKANFKLPIGAEFNSRYSMKGKGMPIMGTSNYGDMIVVIQYKMPKSLTDEEIKIIEKLKESTNFNNLN